MVWEVQPMAIEMQARSETALAGSAPSEEPRTLVELLRRSAERFGGLPALMIRPGFRLRTWSYARLWNDSGRMAAFLRSRDVERGDRVVIWAPNSPAWVVTF